MARQKQPCEDCQGTTHMQSKYSGQDPYLALLAYCSTPMDAYMHSPGEMLYQHSLHTAVPQHICHTDPHATADCDHLDQCASLGTANHDSSRLLTEGPTVCWTDLCLLSMMPDACGPLPLSSMQQTMDHTSSKSSVVDNINVPMTTHVSVTWVLSSPTSMHHHKCSSCYTHTPTCHPGSATRTMFCILQHLSQLQYPTHCRRHPLCTHLPMHSQ